MYYYVLEAGEDGLSVERLTKEILLERLNENYWGCAKIACTLPNNTDPSYWGSLIVIIKGKVVMPTVVETVTKFEVP